MPRILVYFLLILVIFTNFCIGFEPPPERNIFTIAILGDRTGGHPEGLYYLERAVYEINQLNPDFVIHIGDMVQGYTRDQDQWLDQYEEFMSYMDELQVPWYPVAGNHDVFTPIWDKNDRSYENLYKEHFGELRYSFDYKNSHFIIMYTDEAMSSTPEISDEQIQWLKSDLEKTQASSIFVFMHKPVWRYERSNWDAIHQMIKSYPVKAVIAGHFHTYQKDMNMDGIQYYIHGPTGGEFHTSDHEWYGYFHHYSILRVEEDKFSLALVKTGNMEADDYITTEDNIKMRNTALVSSDKTGIKGWLWQPLEDAVEGELELFVHNPLDVSIPVQVYLNPERDLWNMEPPVLGFLMAPNSDERAKVVISAPQSHPADIIPPEIIFEYRYTDSQGRFIPLLVRRRVFLRDEYSVPVTDTPAVLDGVRSEMFWQKAPPLYNHAWVYSVYERPDAPPEVSITTDGEYMYFFAEVMDDNHSYLENNQSRGLLSDAIIFSSLPSSGRREITIFPFNEGGNAFLGKVDERGWLVPSELKEASGVEYYSRTDPQRGYYYCEGKVPLSLIFDGENVSGGDVPFNIIVVDNDKEAFVYVRTWAFDRNPEYWGILKFSD